MHNKYNYFHVANRQTMSPMLFSNKTEKTKQNGHNQKENQKEKHKKTNNKKDTRKRTKPMRQQKKKEKGKKKDMTKLKHTRDKTN